jgi:hypothetical protein
VDGGRGCRRDQACAGQEIESEALRQGPVPVGEAFVTGAGRLKARLVIHAAVMGTDLVTDADKIRSATLCSTAMKPREPSRSTCVKGRLLPDVVVGSSSVDSGCAVWRDGK